MSSLSYLRKLDEYSISVDSEEWIDFGIPHVYMKCGDFWYYQFDFDSYNQAAYIVQELNKKGLKDILWTGYDAELEKDIHIEPKF